MRFYDVTFFVEKPEGIKVKISKNDSDPYPFTITITKNTDAKYSRPAIVFFMEESCLDQFLDCINSETAKLADQELGIASEHEADL